MKFDIHKKRTGRQIQCNNIVGYSYWGHDGHEWPLVFIEASLTRQAYIYIYLVIEGSLNYPLSKFLLK